MAPARARLLHTVEKTAHADLFEYSELVKRTDQWIQRFLFFILMEVEDRGQLELLILYFAKDIFLKTSYQ